MVEINSTLFVEIILFVCLLFALNKIVYQPLLSIMTQRRKKIEDQTHQTKHISSEIETREHSIKDKIRSFKEKTDSNMQQALKDASHEYNSRIHSITEETEKDFQLFKRNLEQETESVLKELNSNIPAIAEQMLKKLLPVFLFLLISCTAVWASEISHSEHSGGISEFARIINFTIMIVLLYFLGRKPIST
ncbi:hypothetical protein JW979_09895, partial [bacterium]|nr:hypothetical protein [candidate division CSSED10-310 bacterium]